MKTLALVLELVMVFSIITSAASSRIILEKLTPGSEEYGTVNNKVQDNILDGSPEYTLTEVFKVTNRIAWSNYERRRDVIRVTAAEDERLLFYSGDDDVDYIVDHGFSKARHSEKGPYGRGIYFRAGSSLVVEQCRKGEDCSPRSMLLCRVLLGKKYSHHDDNEEAPARVPLEYHSIVTSGSILDYPYYIIPKGAQAYPQYLIKYTLPDDDSASAES